MDWIIRLTDHSTFGLLRTIQIPDKSGIQIPTVLTLHLSAEKVGLSQYKLKREQIL